MSIVEYFEALERIKRGNPEKVPLGTKITKGAVAIEAGRKKGSIKKSRSSHIQLVEAIEEAAARQGRPKLDEKEKMDKLKEKIQHYRKLYEDALGREIMLLRKLYELQANNK